MIAGPSSLEELNLSGRVAVVTGGSRGIGRSIAEKLLERGAAVGVMFREREDQAREFEEAARARGGRAWAGRCQLRRRAGDLRISSSRRPPRSGQVDILVNNAGITRDAHALFHDSARWREVMDVNLDAAYYCVRAVVRGMLVRRWGRIINVSSISARVPLAGQLSYAASKAGLEGLTRALSRDLAAKGVLVNAVAPGLIATEMVEAIPKPAREELLKGVALGRIGPTARKWPQSWPFLRQKLPAM